MKICPVPRQTFQVKFGNSFKMEYLPKKSDEVLKSDKADVFEYSNGYKSLLDGDDGVLLDFKKTKKLGDFLDEMANASLNRYKEILGIVAHKGTMKRFMTDLSGSEILDTKITKLLGSGSTAIVFETEDGKVLKITDGNQFRMNRPVEDFDAPIYKRGKCGHTHYYLEEKCSNRGLTVEFVEMIREKIKEKGYRIYDLDEFDVHQIGLSKEGKLYLVDHECAKYKTVFHKIFDVLKRIKH